MAIEAGIEPQSALPEREFNETASSPWSEERELLLRSRIDELGLTIEGSRLAPLVTQLYEELGRAGVDLRPKVFLSDEWGCPEGIPVIGIPFYLADPRLSRLELEVMDNIEAETDREIMAYLRHETGHAFNYAYRLYETEAWHELFGPYSRPYRDDYEPNPFSRNFVRHISGWYAQKHPDEDFAETFAVWLTPGSDWRRRYDGWGCLPKLEYVARIVAALGHAPPLVPADYDTRHELACSIAEYHRKLAYERVELPSYFDGDLKDLFSFEGAATAARQPAAQFLRSMRRRLVVDIAYWTGLQESAVRSLFEHFIERAEALGLELRDDARERLLTNLTAYATTLCMNRLYKGDFIIK
jgi:hypothetical protein